ncbi:ATP-dependent DNA ligase [Marichromatium gracile]|uniref:ATP-dependent DNA ligase n=2 Tax=Marichromatium gracile TaxID=1048 RepID=A0ABR5VGG3_MARGR|nr:ATP-dependent DNA ligase [Marichromatium gracile]
MNGCMLKTQRCLLGASLLLCPWLVAQAHFQTLIPSHEILDAATGPELSLELEFTHPMAGGPRMDMAPPVRFEVLGPQGREDLGARLEVVEHPDGVRGYRADYRVKGPGDHLFMVEPAPYWEPAEGVMIVHYTKVVVDAFDAQDGWDRLLGLPVEIEPLTRPYGLWAGNLFQGVVRRDGEPVPFAEVEVEWRNDGSVEAPAPAFLTQVVRADGDGVFSYVMPFPGWWGFAALLPGEQPMTNPEGEAVAVELGALIWVRARAPE